MTNEKFVCDKTIKKKTSFYSVHYFVVLQCVQKIKEETGKYLMTDNCKFEHRCKFFNVCLNEFSLTQELLKRVSTGFIRNCINLTKKFCFWSKSSNSLQMNLNSPRQE